MSRTACVSYREQVRAVGIEIRHQQNARKHLKPKFSPSHLISTSFVLMSPSHSARRPFQQSESSDDSPLRHQLLDDRLRAGLGSLGRWTGKSGSDAFERSREMGEDDRTEKCYHRKAGIVNHQRYRKKTETKGEKAERSKVITQIYPNSFEYRTMRINRTRIVIIPPVTNLC